MKQFIFDVDGTLTPSRASIDPDFKKWFIDFSKRHAVHYVTGSDKEKTIEQLGEDLFERARYSFNCSGNSVYEYGKLAYKNDWECPDDLWEWLESQLYQSSYPNKYGRNFEQRIGMLNFSVVGREAIGEQRTEYYEWDKINNERKYLAAEINRRWPELQASVGGETGIDIFPKGRDKAQILVWFPTNSEFLFFGDRMDPDGNDFTLSEAIVDKGNGTCYNVKDWKETWDILKDYD